MHYVSEVSLSEDASQICNAAGVVGALRRVAYAVSPTCAERYR